MKVKCTKHALVVAAAGLLAAVAGADNVLSKSNLRPGASANPLGGIAGSCGTSVLSQNASNTVQALSTVQCTQGAITTENGLARSFAVTDDLGVCAVDFTIETCTGGAWPVAVRLYQGNVAGPFGALELRGSSTVVIPNNTNLAGFTATFDPVVNFSAGENMVVELYIASRVPADGGDGGTIFLGSNNLGQTGPTYIRAAGCGAPDFTDLASLGFPDVHIIMGVHVGAQGSGDCPADLNGSGAVDVQDLLILLGAWGPNPGHPADLNDSGSVDVQDLLILLGAWGPCPIVIPTGACCFTGGACSDLTADECSKAGGTFAGAFTNCGSFNCPQPPNGNTCAQAIEVAVGGSANGNTEGNPIANNPFCNGFGPATSGTVWFKVNGNGSTLKAATCGSAPLMSTRIAVYCGTCAFLTCVDSGFEDDDCNDNAFHAATTWCSSDSDTYYIAVWGVGTTEGDVAISITDLGKCNDPVSCSSGLCAGSCGGQSPSGCWCDESCNGFGDCCEGVCIDCPDLSFCEVCEVPNCPKGSIDENEPCGQDTNGGCNSTPNVFTQIACGDTVCGTMWALGGTRDTDWFEFEVAEQTQVTWTVQGSAPVAAFILSGSCPPAVLAVGTGCNVTVSACLPAGTFRVFVGPNTFDGLPCTDNHSYVASLTCEGECALPSCEGSCGGQSPDGCWCDSSCHAFGDCCVDVCDWCPELGGCQPPTCEGACGGQAPNGCWCDESCTGFGDCCPDFCKMCPECASCGGEGCGPQPGSCVGNCGGSSTNCWCDDSCFAFGDCCADVCDACPDLKGCFSGPPPKNDECSGALEIFDGATSFATLGASTHGPAHAACFFFGNDQIFNDIFYVYQATQSGDLTVTTCNAATFDTKLAIYAGAACDLNDGTLLDCNDDFAGCGLTSAVVASVVKGQWYTIRVGAYGATQAGTGTVTLTYEGIPAPSCNGNCGGSAGACWCDESCFGFGDCCPDVCDFCPELSGCGGGNPPPANNDCTGAFEVFLGGNAFSTLDATTTGPAHAACLFFSNDQIYNDAYYYYTADATGLLTVATCGTSWDTKLAVYNTDSCTLSDGTLVACNDDSCGLQSSVSVNVVEGVTYIIRVGAYGQFTTGTGTLTLSY